MIDAAVDSGLVTAIWRYPVKSMLGEELDRTSVSERGLFGDRAFALLDCESGKVISAKNPRKWGNFFAFRSALPNVADRAHGATLPAAQIFFPDGSSATSAEPGIEERLSGVLNRRVRLTASVPPVAQAEGYWPDYHWLEEPETVFEFELPAGTFFDCAPIHLVTTSTLARLAEISPESRFDVARFRPNFVVDCPLAPAGFLENEWVGRTLTIGRQVRVHVVRPAARCIMTTLGQGTLPKDPDILRTAVQNNQGNVGVYATVVRGGFVERGDAVSLV
jgi:uncharacterized protein